MEKISLVLDVDNPEEDLYYCACRHIDCDHTGEWYSAADVDALLAAVRALVETAIDARELMETLPTLHGFIGLAVLEELKQAIAEVERVAKEGGC